MEEATEIAKLRLFLSLVASAETRDQLEPLPNIEFNLLPGNSLIGLLHVDPKKFDSKGGASVSPAASKKRLQQSRIKLQYEEALGFTTETTTAPTTKEKQQAHVAIKQAAKYDELLRRKNERIDLYKKSTSLFKDLAALKRDIDALKSEARDILDQLLLDQFQALGIQYEQASWDSAKKKEGKPVKRPLKLADIQALEPFHWAYEFDSILVERGGFDAIITNPPWEAFKPNGKEFFQKHSDLVTKNAMRLEDFEKEKASLLTKYPEMKTGWLDYLSGFPHVNLYFRNSPQYANQIAIINGRKATTDLNLYKLFTEQCTHLLAFGARCGIVIPSGIYTDLGATQLRRMLFEHTRITGLFGFENRRVIFEGVHRSFKFVVLTFKNAGITTTFPVAFMRHDVRELEGFPESDSIEFCLEMIAKASPDSLSFPEFRSSSDAGVLAKMLHHPLIGESLEGEWKITFCREFHMTDDINLFSTTSPKGHLALYEGKMIWQFDHEYAKPRYWVCEQSGRASLEPSAGHGAILPYQTYRVGFRDITANTNERTLISTILPPMVFAANTVSLVATHIPQSLKLYMVAMFNSFCIDWVIRTKVTNHCNFFYMQQLPIPRLTSSHSDFRPIVERAARLVSTTTEFDDLLAEVFGKKATHKTYGVTDPQDRLTLRAQIDALVARLYDLTIPEFQHILTTFPLVDESVKIQTLNTYRELVKLGKFA